MVEPSLLTIEWRSVFRRLLAGLALMSLAAAHAGKPDNLNEGEMALIPAYCPDTMGFNYGDAYSNTSPKAKHWVGLMGHSFWHMHHYCWALLNLRRADAAGRTAQERRALRESAVGDIGYVVKNSPSNFVLMPEILTKLGGVQLLLSDIGGAYDSFLRARSLKPDYWPAYSDWAEVLIKSGQKPLAKVIVQTGLEHAPDSKVLQDQFRSLGGNPAGIVPIPKPPAPAAIANDPVEGTESATSAEKSAGPVPQKP